ncbi:hypothetical protein C8F01DRAFT_1135902 [Mycena amicta]|nr:hypothetical protein C8F01DRAFT_1135902 [Mycena amicta]
MAGTPSPRTTRTWGRALVYRCVVVALVVCRVVLGSEVGWRRHKHLQGSESESKVIVTTFAEVSCRSARAAKQRRWRRGRSGQRGRTARATMAARKEWVDGRNAKESLGTV